MINVEFVRVEFDKIVQHKLIQIDFRPHKGDVFTWRSEDGNMITTEIYKLEIPDPKNYNYIDLIAYTE